MKTSETRESNRKAGPVPTPIAIEQTGVDACPFCGATPPSEHVAIDGVNCTVCTACHENLHLYTPRVAAVFTESCNLQIAAYDPVVEAWPSNRRAVFLTAFEPTVPVGAFHGYLGVPELSALPDAAQQVLRRLTCDDGVSKENALPGLEHERLCDYPTGLAGITPFQRGVDVTQQRIRRVLSQVPRPMVVTRDAVFAPNVDELITLVRQANGETTQATLGDAV